VGHIHLEHPDKSAVAEHSIDQGHRIQFHNSSILTMKTRYMDCIIREAIDIEIHPYNINRKGGFSLSESRKPLIDSLKLLGHDPSILDDVVPIPCACLQKPQPHSNPSTQAWDLAL
jgi:hypothetical protein